MTWSVSEVIEALSENPRIVESSAKDFIDMKLFDSQTGIGIGVDGIGQRVLILPGQEDVASFVTKNADFDPVCLVSWLEKDISLPSTATLTCRADFSISSVLEAIAVVFLGLIELQERYENAGRAIWEMKELFENGFRASYTEETLVGLIGEVLLINESKSPSSILRYWHTDPADTFDFSSSNLRLEVKTSRGQSRHHTFSSNQLGTNQDNKVIVASFVLNQVEVGSNLREIVDLVSQRLEIQDVPRFLERVIGVLGCSISFTDNYTFDAKSTVGSLMLIEGNLVPNPISSPGILYMSWTADISGLKSMEDTLDEIIERF